MHHLSNGIKIDFRLKLNFDLKQIVINGALSCKKSELLRLNI